MSNHLSEVIAKSRGFRRKLPQQSNHSKRNGCCYRCECPSRQRIRRDADAWMQSKRHVWRRSALRNCSSGAIGDGSVCRQPLCRQGVKQGTSSRGTAASLEAAAHCERDARGHEEALALSPLLLAHRLQPFLHAGTHAAALNGCSRRSSGSTLRCGVRGH